MYIYVCVCNCCTYLSVYNVTCMHVLGLTSWHWRTNWYVLPLEFTVLWCFSLTRTARMLAEQG